MSAEGFFSLKSPGLDSRLLGPDSHGPKCSLAPGSSTLPPSSCSCLPSESVCPVPSHAVLPMCLSTHRLPVIWDMCVCAKSFSRVQLCVTPWTVAVQAPLSMGFSRQEYWSGLPCSPPWDLPNPVIKPASPATPAFQADSSPLSHRGSSIWNKAQLNDLT